MTAGLPVRACLLVVLLVATAAAANRHAPLLPTAQNQRATGDEDAPPTASAHGRYHSEPEQQQLPELPQEGAQLDPAATATAVAAQLVSALLRALAAPSPSESPKFSPNADDDYWLWGSGLCCARGYARVVCGRGRSRAPVPLKLLGF